jgi:aspartyl-tRNA(Asn)/glutamyl-tRNA(Gln) amidotransferase subunit B
LRGASTVSGKLAKEVFEALWNGEGSVEEIIAKRGLVQISDAASIDALVAEVIAANPAQVEQYRSGKTQVLGFLVGQVMKASRGKANPQQVNDALRRRLG